jgi:hypothetical protein
MEEIPRSTAIAHLREHERRGFHVDTRVLDQVGAPGDLYLWRIESSNAFLSLIWQARDGSRLFTPSGQSRTLHDVGRRVLETGLTFSQLASNLDLPPTLHNPSWFTPCERIDNAFDYAAFGYVIVTSALPEELNESPTGSWYIYDGAHKTLVLAERLLAKQQEFVSLQALVLTPRRR